MSATLRVTRETSFGWELRRGVFEIKVDGTAVGSVTLHETAEAAVEPGRHTIRMQAGRYSSRDRSFEVADGDVASFRCHGAMVWPRYVASILRPDLAISLTAQ
jgi:hypothetical protein